MNVTDASPFHSVLEPGLIQKNNFQKTVNIQSSKQVKQRVVLKQSKNIFQLLSFVGGVTKSVEQQGHVVVLTRFCHFENYLQFLQNFKKPYTVCRYIQYVEMDASKIFWPRRGDKT